MKRKFTIVTIIFTVLILSSFALQADTGQQKKPSGADKLAPGQKISDKPSTINKGNRTPTPKPSIEQEKASTVGRILPAQVKNPDLATQPEVDNALYTTEEFFGTNSKTKRSFTDAQKQVGKLISRYPKDPRLLLVSAKLDERLENFDKSVESMKQYVALSGTSPISLRRLADFYHNRAMFKAQVETLQKLALGLKIEEREPVYREIISIVRDHEVKGFSIEEAYKELLAGDKDNIGLVKSYVEELVLKKRYNEATSVLDSYQSKYSNELNYFLAKRSSIYEEQGDRLKAEAVYKEAFDPLWSNDISTNYYELLRRLGRYRNYRRDLQTETTKNPSFNSVTRLFDLYAYEENKPLAFNLLKNYEAKRGQQANWKTQELETLAGLYMSIGSYDEASRYLYTLYLSQGIKPGSKEREKYLSKLFNILMDAGSQPIRLSSGDLSLYKDIGTVDQNPGLLNGVLSLILSNTNIGYEFQEKENNAASYFNRSFAYRIFNSFKQEYSNSEELPAMYSYLMTMFAGFGEHKLVINLGKEFQTKFPQAPNYSQVTLQIADAYVALGQRDAERTLLAQLLDKIAEQNANRVLLPSSRTVQTPNPQVDAVVDQIVQDIQFYSDTYNPIWMSKDNGNENYNNTPNTYSSNDGTVNYSRVLERMVSSFATEGKKQETLKFFWGEIKKHPKEEGLYERMLKWLESAKLFEEEFKVYTAAINNFQENSWYHSLTRWYIRNKRGAEFKAYSKEIIETLDQEDIREYLDRFVLMSYGKVSDINYDSKLYFELYSYALKRFPNNIAFVNGMLRYYAINKNWAEWEKLCFEYYPADSSIRENLLRYLASNKKLQINFEQAKQKSTTSLVYQQFTADAAIKLSHFDEALDTYKLLVANYPGDTQYALKLADLMRSFSYQGDKFSEESAKVYLQLARIYPTNHDYKTKAGEVFADMSDFGRARQVWDGILANELGVSNTYLEVASIYWDYYQYDDAIRVINNYRENTSDKTALAYKMGAIYEGKNQWKQAINEYVSVLSEEVGRNVVIKRLAQLAPRRDFGKAIDSSYERQIAGNPSNWSLSLGYSEYLRSAGRETDADNFLRQQVATSNQIEFLEAIRDVFHRERLSKDEEQSLIRLASVARDERESMKYRLQQAEFYEQKRDLNRAGEVFEKLLAQYPSNLGVIQDASQFFSRAGLADKSIALFKQAASRAQGNYRKQFTLQLAKELEKANRLDESEQVLNVWYKEHPLDNDFFRNLVALLGKANKTEALVELYKNALKQPSTSGLSPDETKAYVVNLRLAMIDTLAKLNRHSEVVDQYIEVINKQFDNAQVIDAAFRYAQVNNQLDRFTAYYEDLSKKSFKDYRWNLVLSAIYASKGEIPKQIEQYKFALVNEPQRLDLREILAGLYSREQRYDEAVTALRRNFEIDGNNPEWLTKIAKVQIQADKPDAAVATLRDSLAKNPKVTARLLFTAGKLLADRNYTKQAFDFYKEAVALVKTKPTKESIDAQQIADYSLAMLKTTNPVTTYQELKDIETKLGAIPAEEDEKNYASSTKYIVEGFLKSSFGTQMISFSSPKERLDLATKLLQSVKSINKYDADGETALRNVLSLAENAGLTELQENLLIKMENLSYDVSINKYYNNIVSLLGFYEKYAMYSKAAELLQAEKKLGHWNIRGDENSINLEQAYYELVSDYWHKAGMSTQELAVLSEYYRSRSGDVTGNTSPLVQRYFTLLVELNQKNEFKQIVAKSNPYQLQLINFLILRKEKDLALQAIDSTKLSSAWKSSRRAQVGLYFQDNSPEVEKSFQVALDLKSIGQTVKNQPSDEKVLPGSDWYVAASNYGVWLGLSQDRVSQARKYIVARAEDKPNDAVAQLELANFYINNKIFKLAEEHLALASELAPNSPAISVAQGNYHFVRGDKDKALATWNTLIAKRNSGLLQYNSYFDALASHNLTEKALPNVGRFLSRAVTKVSWDGLSPFVRKVALAGKNDANLSKAIADTLYQVMRDNPNNIKLGQMLVEEDLITATEAKITIYRAMLERYQDLLIAISVTGGSYRDGDYYYSEKARTLLDGHEKKLIDFLIAQRQFDQVKQNLRYLQDSHSELNIEITPEWMEMASAVVELRSGTVENALTALRRYVGLNKDVNSNGDNTRHLKAYALLVNERQPQAADQLLYDYYQSQLRIGQGTIANYTGVAGVEFRRANNKEALEWLQKMVAIIGTAEASIEAGKLAERYELHKEAFEWRSKAAKLDPAQIENRLELARNAALIGQNQEGVSILKQLIENRGTDNTIRAQAIALIPMVAGGKDGANAVLANFQNNPDYYAQLVTSGLLIAADRKAEARLILQQASKQSTAAQARLMLAALEASEKGAGAKTALQDALYADSRATISQAIAFSLDDPNSLLVQAFISNNQFNAALAFSPIKAKRMLAPDEEGEGDYSENSGNDSESKQIADFRSFNYQEIDVALKQAKYLTLSELASERRKATENKLLESLIDVAIKVGDLPQAIGLILDYQTRINNPQQFALLEGKRKTLVNQLNDTQALEEATLKLGTELTQSVLDQLLSKSIGNDALSSSKQSEGL